MADEAPENPVAEQSQEPTEQPAEQQQEAEATTQETAAEQQEQTGEKPPEEAAEPTQSAEPVAADGQQEAGEETQKPTEKAPVQEAEQAAEQQEPEQAAQEPEKAAQEPEQAAQEPEKATQEAAQEPEKAAQEPEKAAQEPEQAAQEPEKATQEAAQEPKKAAQEPEQATQEPEQAPQEPEQATQEPEQASQEPEQAAPEPEQAAQQPTAPVAEKTQASEPEKPAEGQVAASTTPEPSYQQEVDPHAASPTPRADTNTAACTVKFMLMPSGQVHTERCGLDQTLLELKQHLSNELKIPAGVIILTKDGKETKDQQLLPELGVGPNGTVPLEVLSADPGNYPIKTLKKRTDYQMPDVITVRVFTETNEVKDVVVEIERATRKKPFLGGYRHKKNGLEYHHASAQTMQKQRPPPAVERFCRDSQTVQERHLVQQTFNDMSTQMTKVGVYVSNMEDKLVVPGRYTTADEFRKNIFNKVLVIQKYYRRWLAKRYVERIRKDKAARLEWERQEELKKKKEKADRIKREFDRRMNPKTKEDFDLLYHALEKWRQEELERINAELTGAERKAALCQLLDQETQLIASIGRHKLDADDENRTKTIQGFLDKAAAPKKWKGRDGKMTEMDTPYTIRAQELRDIYNSINMKYLTQDERLDVLLTLKHTVKEHDCKLTQEIIELIDREADLLMRGVKESNLDGLRRRISTLFLQYIKTPTFNPEAARLLKVPQDPSVLRKDIYFCQSCNQYKPSTEFQLSSNSGSVGRCRKCNKVDNDARTRQDYSHFRYMLKALRRSEEGYDDDSKICYLLQEGDLRYLVENVWNSHSILSAWEDLYDLVLVRWDKHTEWSPWNCILITKEEAASHEKLENLDEAYGKALIHKIKHKHTLARNYFSRLPGMAQFMRGMNEKTMPNGPSISGKKLPVPPVQ